MKLKKLKKKIQQLEKRLREGPEKLAIKTQTAAGRVGKGVESCEKIGRPSHCVSRKEVWEPTTGAKKPSSAKKAKRKLNLSPERRAQLAAAMKARWAAKRAAEGNSTTSSDQNSPTPPPENRGDGV
jgi:hypothetical protein